MNTDEMIELKRECEVIEVPSGTPARLPAGSRVRRMESPGSDFTVVSERYRMYRIAQKDADALGLEVAAEGGEHPSRDLAFREEMVWEELKTVYDPEIPVNIVDLGLIYSCDVKQHEEGGKRIDINMSMTAPGCGMGNVLKADVEHKVGRLPEVKEVRVEIVFDPPWNMGRMSEAARLQLGID